MGMNKRPRNAVDEAIEAVDGPTKASFLLRVSSAAIQNWRRDGRMPTDTPEARDRIRLLARASGVSALRLAGLDDGADAPAAPVGEGPQRPTGGSSGSSP